MYMVATKNNPNCLHCLKGLLVQQYSETDLYLQLNYYNYIFDLSHYSSKFTRTLPLDIREAHDKLREMVRQFLVQSKYATVRMSTLYMNYAINDATGQKVNAVKAFAEVATTKVGGGEAKVKREGKMGAPTATKKRHFPFGKFLNRK
ncbi:DNA polymerase alpha catalytic subunit [Culex quinquefasciatus]|uniref:DNA polymerase alpha catalytic subunit n=1 Tax=Culex quinquefasciatus TaxID=7176 RepID=B0X7P7_CULQU|nr:DNA polymerase alpha catalytic subunit [Culex quinquefasciatus]|eukprot:XP_001865669.1 DNA polymerase alpha catalytic subunit [Culex quinquefasciatus]